MLFGGRPPVRNPPEPAGSRPVLSSGTLPSITSASLSNSWHCDAGNMVSLVRSPMCAWRDAVLPASWC
eukprot:5865728-Pyramimonas_sp.AAC.1